jgi:hypothetical protein
MLYGALFTGGCILCGTVVWLKPVFIENELSKHSSRGFVQYQIIRSILQTVLLTLIIS